MFFIRPGVGKKLLGLALFHAAAFALIAVIAATAFNRVEILATDIARNQMTGCWKMPRLLASCPMRFRKSI